MSDWEVRGMRDIDQVKALLGFIAFELGIVIGLLWAVIA